jgi:hypothetical protein
MCVPTAPHRVGGYCEVDSLVGGWVGGRRPEVRSWSHVQLASER